MMACALALLLALPLLRQELHSAKARHAIAKISPATPEDSDASVNIARKALSRPGASGNLLNLAAQLALLDTVQNAETAQDYTWQSLQESPTRAEGWARLAYIDLLANGKFTKDAISYLEHSFVAEPAGYQDFMVWRLEFIFANWQHLPLSLQQQALFSLRMMAQSKGKEFAFNMMRQFNNQDLIIRASAALSLN